MPRKPKFNPVITKIKLCPEQAVLECSCYFLGREGTDSEINIDDPNMCFYREPKTPGGCFSGTSAASS